MKTGRKAHRPNAVRQLVMALFVIVSTLATWLLVAQSTSTVTGRLEIEHPYFDDFVFARSYVYVFDTNEYVEVNPDGTFEVVELVDGRHSFKTYVPGFEPTYRTVEIPDQREIVLPIRLQTFEIASIVSEREVSSYLESIRDLTTSSVIEEETPSTEPIPLPESDGTPPDEGLDLSPIIDSFRSLFRRDRGRDADE